ncbi:MAG TPA: hypothetical protein VHM70_31125 [Polyangiaceae bacterium]|nr:hypothetical protein [Polyangiaceae bacterium]
MRLSPSPTLRCAALIVGCVLSLIWTQAAPAVGFLVLVVGLSLPKMTGSERRWAWGLLWASALIACVAFVRFVLVQAIPGVIAGGKAAASKHAIAFARGLVVAQDHARETAANDPDHDGVGSALTLAALAGLAPLPDGKVLDKPPLAVRPDQVKDTPLGDAIEQGGYYFALCLPDQKGALVGAVDLAKVDAKAAEHRYLIYGWPVSNSAGSPVQALAVDADERIMVTSPDGPRLYFANEGAPHCESSSTEPGWSEWKAARASAATNP